MAILCCVAQKTASTAQFWFLQEKSTNKFHANVPLKGPKLEIFRPVWIGVLRTRQKISKT
jgi:hypothetical protein